MPMYTFRRISTNEEWESLVSFSKREEILKDDDIIQIIGAPKIISGVPGVTHKTDSGFKDMMSRIGEANPNSPMGQEYGKKDVKSSKTRDVAKKHNLT